MAIVSDDLFLDRVATSIGEILIVADAKGALCALEFHDKPERWRKDFARRFANAQFIEKPAAMRAVGLANGANPIAIVVPCHRVVGSDGALTGYGGGLERKRWLLDHERKHI
jgi:O-6-methylguanine DNA methyltransferase